jgi:hypothetical protein
MKIKRLAAFLLIGMISLSQSVFASAHMLPNEVGGTGDKISVSPQWDHVNDITLDMYYENGKANCSGKIRALSGTTKISAVFKLERKTGSGWSFEKSWSKSSNFSTLSFFDTYSVPKGYTYRLSVTADVTRNGTTETVTSSVSGNY